MEIFLILSLFIQINTYYNPFFTQNKFPTSEKVMNFVGLKKNTAIALLINKISDTHIDYSLEITVFGGQSVRKTGIAVLHKFPSDTKMEDSSYTSFDWVEFIHLKNGNCKTHIKLAYHRESQKYGFAQIYQNCNTHTQNITFDNFPMLRKK
jgi:hypothetical protein